VLAVDIQQGKLVALVARTSVDTLAAASGNLRDSRAVVVVRTIVDTLVAAALGNLQDRQAVGADRSPVGRLAGELVQLELLDILEGRDFVQVFHRFLGTSVSPAVG